jgi:hypothetical protein
MYIHHLCTSRPSKLNYADNSVTKKVKIEGKVYRRTGHEGPEEK